MLSKILNKIFTDFLWPKWLGFISKSDSPRVWKKTFSTTAIQTNTLSKNLAEEISKSPSVVRLMVNTFKPDRNFPSAEDYAISIGYELIQKDYHFSLEEKIKTWQIRNFSAAVRREWLNTINENPILKARLKDIRDKHPSEFMLENASCDTSFDSILQNPNKLRKLYFESFTTPDKTEEVIVWLPNEYDVVAWSPDKRITVKVGLNASLGADLGFIRVGQDYSLFDTSNEVEWLQVAYRDDARAIETMNFGSRSVGCATNHILWCK
ncbi:hypothetical protein ES754_11645 [Psychrobacter frigidicola]|uniref:Uncharacterized protein n=1 Tax=Psychrobacter frigidicola TaxID=45611 RepID=A0A5C7A1E8_9GAMM|nr:hypothetical protein [Psychrobacter frigidicola]TXD96276.1 hypothetical protein ES754_11645 [Psychrobacter frigidicola]